MKEKIIGLDSGADDYFIKPFDEEKSLVISKCHVPIYTASMAIVKLSCVSRKASFARCSVLELLTVVGSINNKYLLIQPFERTDD